ncbi:hypothetical protein LPTSP3_g31480 [Leptospira kobayashii]|uniref:Toxin-antitoxin system, toxin component, RelE family n=1 Tax=Leptospira kobayashii TaxID=1917830 RepID=A0ABN6KG86_9LEPT|nr:hypothetical protein LPTSP3_g31480 [Leptospira kobayashii]
MTIPYSVGIIGLLKRLFIHFQDFDQFWKHAKLRDEELLEFQSYLLENPKSGVVIPGSNGLRKIRWKKKGTGKSSGIRVFYLDLEEFGTTFLISLIEKNDQENLSKAQLKILSQLVQTLKDNMKKGRVTNGKTK